LSGLLATFLPTSLAELDSAALLDRVDTKFLLPSSRVPSVLSALWGDYRVLDIDGVRQHTYRTRYFDTPGFDSFYDHLADIDTRHKIRSRTYIESGLTFLEVKTKAKGRTIKARRQIPRRLRRITEPARSFIATHTPFEGVDWRPAVDNQFQRITLVHRHYAERLTLDVGIRFDFRRRTVVLPGIAVAEVKQAKANANSPFLQEMDVASIVPTGMSKYCVGVALLNSQLAHNGLEPTMQAIAAVMRDAAEDANGTSGATLPSHRALVSTGCAQGSPLAR
jgi:hypothetical protein